MTIWHNSKMSTLFYSAGEAWENHPCIVQIDDENILVKYMEDGAQVQYVGENLGDGHFHLTSTHLNGRATLHRFPARADTNRGNDADVLEGYWTEAGNRGMWRIELFELSEHETAEVSPNEKDGWA